MSDDKRLDQRLAALFAAPDKAPDEAFVRRVERAVLAEQRVWAARKAAWRRFWGEAAASVAVVAAFALLWRLVPAAATLSELPAVPGAAAAVLVLALWFAIELRPAAAGR